MPYSAREGKTEAAGWVRDLAPERIVDVGAGAGRWRDAIDVDAHWTAVEVWRPYIDEFNLEARYDRVVQQDAREVDWQALSPDLVICGDVLEHMTTDEAVALVRAARQAGAWVLVSIPIVHYEQGAIHDNPFEVHVRPDWTDYEVRARWSPTHAWTGEVVGVYLIAP